MIMIDPRASPYASHRMVDPQSISELWKQTKTNVWNTKEHEWRNSTPSVLKFEINELCVEPITPSLTSHYNTSSQSVFFQRSRLALTCCKITGLFKITKTHEISTQFILKLIFGTGQFFGNSFGFRFAYLSST